MLTDEQFETFVEKTLLTPHTTRILAGLVPAIPEPVAESDTVVTPEVGTNDDGNISTSAGVAS